MKQDSRGKILNAAAKLFRTQGYHATSLSQITKESEVKLENGHSKLRQKKIQLYYIKFTKGAHDYGQRHEPRL